MVFGQKLEHIHSDNFAFNLSIRTGSLACGGRNLLKPLDEFSIGFSLFVKFAEGFRFSAQQVQ
jgi:hypothetical protein